MFNTDYSNNQPSLVQVQIFMYQSVQTNDFMMVIPQGTRDARGKEEYQKSVFLHCLKKDVDNKRGKKLY